MSNLPDATDARVNERILEKLKHYPPGVAELAARAIQLSEELPEATVAEMLQTTIREVLAQEGEEG